MTHQNYKGKAKELGHQMVGCFKNYNRPEQKQSVAAQEKEKLTTDLINGCMVPSNISVLNLFLVMFFRQN